MCIHKSATTFNFFMPFILTSIYCVRMMIIKHTSFKVTADLQAIIFPWQYAKVYHLNNNAYLLLPYYLSCIMAYPSSCCLTCMSLQYINSNLNNHTSAYKKGKLNSTSKVLLYMKNLLHIFVLQKTLLMLTGYCLIKSHTQVF